MIISSLIRHIIGKSITNINSISTRGFCYPSKEQVSWIQLKNPEIRRNGCAKKKELFHSLRLEAESITETGLCPVATYGTTSVEAAVLLQHVITVMCWYLESPK